MNVNKSRVGNIIFQMNANIWEQFYVVFFIFMFRANSQHSIKHPSQMIQY